MSLRPEQSKFFADMAVFCTWLISQGYEATDGEAYRTEVEAWVNSLPPKSLLKGTAPGRREYDYMIAVGGYGIQNSKHRQKLARDINIFKDGVLITSKADLKAIGAYWENLSPGKNRWGGNFLDREDTDHFERNV